jgi:hypothetical protein
MEEKVIELNKAKLKLLTVVSCASLALSLWMLSFDQAGVESHRLNGQTSAHGIWVASIVFFGLCAIFGIRKLLEKKPGLVFNSAGLLDNASLVPAGVIPWSEITGVGALEVKKQTLLVVKLADPQKYIDGSGALKRALRRTTFSTYGSPVVIPLSAVNIGFNELLTLFNRYLPEHGKASGADR